MSGHGDRGGQRQPVGGRHRPRRPARDPRRRLGAVRDLAQGRRHRGARLGRAHERLHGPEGAAWWCAATPARRWATRSTRRGCTCAARSPGSAPTAWRRRCATSTLAQLRELLAAAEIDADPAEFTPLRLGAAALQLQGRQRRGRTDDERDHQRPRPLAARPARVGHVRPRHDRRDPARRARGHLRHPRLRRQAPRAALRRPAVPRRQRVALSAGGLPRALRHRRHASGPASRASRSSSTSRSRSPG